MNPAFPSFGPSGSNPNGPALEELAILRELLSHLEEVFWVRDLREERLIYVSPGFERVWGRSAESLLASPRVWADSIHPDDRERILSAAMVEIRQSRESGEYRIVRPDGTIRWVEDKSVPIRDARGNVYRVAGIVRDITERRRAQEAAASSS